MMSRNNRLDNVFKASYGVVMNYPGSYQITDPKGQVAVLRLANWWMRLAENYHSRKPHQGDTQ
jgi:hypothetical protein